MAEQILHEAKNTVVIMGIAQESTLAVKEFNTNGKPYKAIAGDVTIRVNEEESHTIAYFVKELTKDGVLSKSFKAMETVMKNIVTLADIEQGIREGEATRLRAQGKLDLNEYRSQDGRIRSNMRISGQFAPSSSFDRAPYSPKAEFDVEGIVKSVRIETEGEDEVETGRYIIDLYVPRYDGSVIPLKFITKANLEAREIDYIESDIVPRASVNVWGNLVNVNKKITRIIGKGFGTKEDTTWTRHRELYAAGAAAFEEEDKIWDVKLLKEALANRERYLSTLVAKEDKKDNKSVGFGNSNPAENKTTQPNKTVLKEDDLEDLFGED